MRKWQTCQAEGSLEGRPRRFSVSMRLRYRLANELEWREGKVENISASGVVFQVDDLEGLRERDTPLELSFPVPKEIGGDGATWVFFRAYTKRILPASGRHASPAVAVRISDFMFPLEQGHWVPRGTPEELQTNSPPHDFRRTPSALGDQLKPGAD